MVGLQTSTPDILVPNHPAVAADLPRPLGKKGLRQKAKIKFKN